MAIDRFDIKSAFPDEVVEAERAESANEVHAYLEYHLEIGKVLLEFAARHICEDLIGFRPKFQKKVAGLLVSRLPKIGSQLIITGTDDGDEKNKKARKSRVIRVEPDDGYDVHLVMTL